MTETDQMISYLRSRDDKLCADAANEIERLQGICKTIASGLRGEYASRLDMAKLAESAFQQ